MNDTVHHLHHGNKYPYDADEDDDGEYCPVQNEDDWSFRAARGVLSDLNDRRNIKHGFDDIDHSIRVEIVAALAGIIRLANNHRPAQSTEES